MAEEQKRPVYKNLLFWFFIIIIILIISGTVIGEEIPDWLEAIRRLLR